MSVFLFLLSHWRVWNNALFFSNLTPTTTFVFMLKAMFRICFPISGFTQLFPKMFTFSNPLEIVSFDVNLLSPPWILEGSAVLKHHPVLPSPSTQKDVQKGWQQPCQEIWGPLWVPGAPWVPSLSWHHQHGLSHRQRCSCPAVQRRAWHADSWWSWATPACRGLEKLGSWWSGRLRWEAGGAWVPEHVLKDAITLVLRPELKGHHSSGTACCPPSRPLLHTAYL